MVSKKSKYFHIGLQVYIFEKFTSKKSLSKLFKVDHFSILIVNSGSLSILIDNTEVTVFESEILVIPIKTSFEILIMSDQLQICLLSFTTDFVIENSIRRPHIRYFEFFITQLSSKIFLKSKDVLLLIDLLTLLNSKVLRPSSHVFKDEIILFSFNLLLYELAGIYHRSSWHISLQHSKREKLVLQFFKILEMNCRKQHSVKYYANYLGVNTDHFSRIVKQVTEKTAKQFIEEAILLEAKVLLQNNHLTILYIGEELHFSNSSAFSTFFKRHTSLSPSEYRLQLNSN
ncbi:AraC family transcriptional regulator [Flavobacterium sp. 90]|uniref:helix-turn-helix domain-containing protein n=2 Tax=Flavobacterium TaxID=237 RepID=UPI000911D4F1|nr:helix-turn-helix domain-containing protein [Flavobacterium aquidurense]RKR08892.1 AraC family transcriptional regulator [Flavobacterium sp. 81]TCK52680.1 AraC family transcriptional regulator [Flavobacterium sp. 90]SHG69918.1 transcriptional regulator, AraC family [Flavobacterium frigidimaris]